MLNIVNMIEELKMVDSKTTDKLKLICNAAVELLKVDPSLTEKVKSIMVMWTKVDDIAVPDIKIEFHE